MRCVSVVLACVLLLSAIALGGTEEQRGGARTPYRLVSTQGLSEMLDKGEVSVIDMRSDINEYLKGHIPEALYLHFETLRSSRLGVPADMLPGEQYAVLFSRLGLHMDRPVVIYGTGDANNFYATFPAWLLSAFGHPSVYVLDGGYEKWTKEKLPIAREYPKVEPSTFPAKDFSLAMVSADVVKQAMERKNAVLVDARPVDQYEGKAGAQMRLGHIPGAISHPWASDLVQTETGKAWKSADELRKNYEQQGISPDKNVIVYCNTGTEATHLYFALREILGFPNVSVYVPSFTEWSARPELPVATGSQLR